MSVRARVSARFAAIAVVAVTVVAALLGGPYPGAVAGTPTKAAAVHGFPAHLAAAVAVPKSAASVYVPITPCRIVNTLLVSGGGRFANNTTRSYRVAGTSGFPAQGGTSGGCAIPTYATAITANLTANKPVGNGYLRGWPTGGSEPSGGLLTYPDGIGVTSGATIAIKPGGGIALTIRNHTGATDLVIDATGYYTPGIYGTFNATGTLVAGSGRLTGLSHDATGSWTVRADRELTGCGVAVTSYRYGFGASGYVEGNNVYVMMVDAAGAGVDWFFQVIVDC